MSRSSGLSFCNEAQVYPPESKIARVVSNRNLHFQGSIFRGYVSFREGTWGNSIASRKAAGVSARKTGARCLVSSK